MEQVALVQKVSISLSYKILVQPGYNSMIDFPIINSHVRLLDRGHALAIAGRTGRPALKRDFTSDDLAACAKPYEMRGVGFLRG